jgi:DNA repair exonuclease SbcCD ATPase subunit
LEALGSEYLRATEAITAAFLVSARVLLELKELIDPDIEEKYKVAEEAVRITRLAKIKLSEEITRHDSIIETAEKEILRLISYETEVEATEEIIKTFQGESSQWSYLVDACSKDGLRALEIEGVAPVITGYANDMLTSTFGPSHTVRFETQDENGKEVLDIVIIREDGSETLLSNGSGGEQVWILKSLRLAQTLISQEKSGRHFQTALMDEEDGALSNKNAIKFISLYKTLMKMADMESCYFISHRPDAINLADNRIILAKGGIKIT